VLQFQKLYTGLQVSESRRRDVLRENPHGDISEEEPETDGDVEESWDEPFIAMQDESTNPPASISNFFFNGVYAVTSNQMIACPKGRYLRQ
jgi:hypothetical protein